MGIQLSDRVENIVVKGEIAGYEQFLLFPQCFQKLSVCQNEYLWSKRLKRRTFWKQALPSTTQPQVLET